MKKESLVDPKKFFKKKAPKNESESFVKQIATNNQERRKSPIRRKPGY